MSLINEKVSALEVHVRKRDYWRESKIVTVEPPDGRCLHLWINNTRM